MTVETSLRAALCSTAALRLPALALALIVVCAPADAQSSGADVARQIRESGLDPEECYRVRDLAFSKEDVRLFFTEGHLIFGKQVEGKRFSAVFSAEVEGGDGEILLLPPNRGERMSLARFTESPNLNEHLRSVVLVFTDDSGEKLRSLVSPEKKSAEMGALMAERYRSVVANLATSFLARVAGDLMSPRSQQLGMFYAAMAGNKLGNFDVMIDPRSAQQIVLGQVSYRDTRAYFDTWSAFTARSWRNGSERLPEQEFRIEDVRIDVTLNPDLNLTGTTRMAVIPSVDRERVHVFDISRRMRITAAAVDGKPCEIFQRESLRAGLIRGSEDDAFLVVTPEPLDRWRRYEFEFKQEGNVVLQAGEGVYYVGARASWYPRRGLQFARYDMTFRYPKTLNLVATGEVAEQHEDGEWRITRRRTSSPVRLAGFNLGEYREIDLRRGGYTIEVYANRKLEPGLEDRSRSVLIVPPAPGVPKPRRPGDLLAVPEAPAPNPGARLEQLASEIDGALEYMSGFLGPAPLKTLTVSPIPGTFGQGFPGLVYLSTLSYLDPRDRPAHLRGELQRIFYSEILHAHEVAHQWWGNTVTSAGYEDEWVMEALANYCALMYLEKRKGVRSLDSVLDDYRYHLLAKTESGETIESSGPIVWGYRLQTSLAPSAWRAITYEKGSWIVHMLRRRLGDAKFLAMLGELRKRYEYKSVSTDEFRALAASFLPAGSQDPRLEMFFDAWVYGTGIPSVKLSHSVQGKSGALKLSGSVGLSGVEDDFSITVPIEVQTAPGKSVTHWVRAGAEATPFNIPLKQRPGKVTLAPGYSILAR